MTGATPPTSHDRPALPGDTRRDPTGPDHRTSDEIGSFRLSFELRGTEIVGCLHRPAACPHRLPLVVMGHGFSGTQDRLFEIARPLRRGRSCGADLRLPLLRRKWRRAATRGQRRPPVGGLAVDDPGRPRTVRRRPRPKSPCGGPHSAGHVVTVAAGDPRIAAVVAQVPFNGFPRTVEGRSTRETLRLLWAMSLDAARGRLSLSPHYIPMIGEPGEVAVTATGRANDHLATMSGGTGNTLWRNQIAPRGLFGMMRYRPGKVAHRLGMPLLVCLVEQELGPDNSMRQIAERAPYGEQRRYPGDHFDIYRDPVRQKVVVDQIAFLRKHLVQVPLAATQPPRD